MKIFLVELFAHSLLGISIFNFRNEKKLLVFIFECDGM